MKKLYPLLSVLFLIFWGCLDPLNIFDFNDEETVDEEIETGPSVNLWGVDYSIENTTVLYLNGNSITGSIPPEIGNLTNLITLGLDDNQLTGSIPPEIGNLTNLQQLGLSWNQLSGEIPSEIGNLVNLTYLELFLNQLTGEIPSEIWNLTNLQIFLLNDNQVQGEIPDSICDLNINWYDSNYFNISNNQLCPPYPSCIEDDVGEQDTSDCD